MKKLKIVAVLLLAVAVFNDCNSSSDLDFFGNPKKLLIGYYGGANPQQIESALEPFRAYLQKKLDIDVQFYYTSDYSSVTDALKAKKIQMAYFTAFAYVIATRKPGLTPVATMGVKGKPATYHSIIFTDTKTGLKTMADVKDRSKDLSLCFVDKTSTTGLLVPCAYLNSIGLNPDSAFRQTFYAGSLKASVKAVKSQKADIGCSSLERGLNLLIREDSVKKDDIVVLWTSVPVPFEAVAARSDLNKDFIKKVQDAYLSAAKDDFPAFSKYVNLIWPNSETMSYVPVQDNMYNLLRKAAANTSFIK